MTISLDNILLLGSILLLIGLIGSRTTKYGIPVLLLFLIVGMLAGSDGFGGIYFYDPKTSKFIGAVALLDIPVILTPIPGYCPPLRFYFKEQMSYDIFSVIFFFLSFLL